MRASAICGAIVWIAFSLSPWRLAHAQAWGEHLAYLRAELDGYFEDADVKRAIQVLGDDSLSDHNRVVSLLSVVDGVSSTWKAGMSYNEKCAKNLLAATVVNIINDTLHVHYPWYKDKIKDVLGAAIRRNDEVLFVVFGPLSEFARELVGADVLRARLLSVNTNVGAYAMLLYYQGYGKPDDFPAMRKFAAAAKFDVATWTEEIIKNIQKKSDNKPRNYSEDIELLEPGFFRKSEADLRARGFAFP